MKIIFLVIFWSYGFLWYLTDEQILDYYHHKDFADKYKILRNHLNFVCIVIALDVLRRLFKWSVGDQWVWRDRKEFVWELIDFYKAMNGSDFIRI